MTTMRVLGMLMVASAVAKVVGLGMASQASADAASPVAPPTAPAAVADAPCVEDGRGFRELLETVRAKAAELERREAALAARESGLAAARRIVTSEVTRLEGVAKALGLTGTPGAPVSIAKVYETMPAEDAAPILDRLDDRMLRTVLGRMRERQLGAILAAMSPERAVAVTKALAGPAAPAAPTPR
jgi:flagellar motility protein MotE (MotC chaperone)